MSYGKARFRQIYIKSDFERIIYIVTSSCFWRHQMETFSTLLAIWPVNSPHKGRWRGALIFSLIYARINDWVNKREAGDLRRHRAHYDVIVIRWMCSQWSIRNSHCSYTTDFEAWHGCHRVWFDCTILHIMLYHTFRETLSVLRSI